MEAPKPYAAKKFDLHGLQGISDKTLETHFKLYEGYVKETNGLRDKAHELLADGGFDREEKPAYAELTRRLGFENNGMVLHEYYFENLTRGGAGAPARNAKLREAAEASFGSFDTWRTDFASVGKMRGVGWAICYQDPTNGALSNHWVTLHEVGNVTGFTPVLVMDVWEHAYMLDYKPADRSKYIEAFFANTDWDVVEARLAGGATQRRRATG